MAYKQQLRMGKKVEKEHKNTYNILQKKKLSANKFYESIAKDHLSEFPNKPYYSELDKMEKKLKS